MGFRLNNGSIRGVIDRDDGRRPRLEFEVAGAFDAFVSLEEIAPNAEWLDVLAESWGLPSPSAETLARITLTSQ